MNDETQHKSMDGLIETMSEHFKEFEADYRNEEWCDIVYEDEAVVVLADHKGHELTEWGDDYGDYYAVSEHMHDRANELCDYSWNSSWPVVFENDI